ncbi:glucose-1-phosphate thymidylyltransferase [Flaviaesturariibacter flavus]|uniref:Glucose-1-phosphate thymidylyltransferase n=1 Tax=Flaviaesturariibacter flavus TaxID=2502780 RepID=A0A4V2NWZ7_9BACT|nr:putative sugar nucleotidyl transferase [Flaviaesturariibacter flavus]TCJ19302.1 glucose-1-phosphate thymidylyltransferase [Flaviaesturariibacter flavus]
MEKIVFTEEFCNPGQLFPFTLTRSIPDFRVGILTIREKWERLLGLPSFDKQEGDYKDGPGALVIDESIGKDIIYLVHGNILPTPALAGEVQALRPGEFLSLPERESFIYCISRKQVLDANRVKMEKAVEAKSEFRELRAPWDITRYNAWAIEQDFALLTQKRKSQGAPRTTAMTNAARIFIEKGARVEHCILNATEGPIYIGNGAQVMEGSLLRGPVAICEGATVKMGTRIYGATTIGPACVVGGEIKNSVLFGNSNKAHDGYLGDSVLGEWCNLGAGTSNSNIKNNASAVRVYLPDGIKEAGTKCGLFMGDYSRTAINTSINTGTVVGVSCNLFGSGIPPKYVPSFSWGQDGIERYELEKALEHIANWKKLKGLELGAEEEAILREVYRRY